MLFEFYDKFRFVSKIGVARIFFGVHVPPPKKLTVFQSLASKEAETTKVTTHHSHSPDLPIFLMKLKDRLLLCLGVHYNFSVYIWHKKILAALWGCTCTQCTHWLAYVSE